VVCCVMCYYCIMFIQFFPESILGEEIPTLEPVKDLVSK
jgi:hypothetical protein